MAKTKNTINDLRDHLFMQLERLNDEDCTPADVDKANAAASVANQILQSAKIENDYLKMRIGLGGGNIKTTGFVANQLTEGVSDEETNR